MYSLKQIYVIIRTIYPHVTGYTQCRLIKALSVSQRFIVQGVDAAQWIRSISHNHTVVSSSPTVVNRDALLSTALYSDYSTLPSWKWVPWAIVRSVLVAVPWLARILPLP